MEASCQEQGKAPCYLLPPGLCEDALNLLALQGEFLQIVPQLVAGT